MDQQTTSIGKIGGMEIHAGTKAGASYVSKVTHPPSPLTSDYCGRPDCSAPNVVLMELKTEQNIPPILVIPTSITATKTINPGTIVMLSTSGCQTSNYIFMPVADSATTAVGLVQPINQVAVTGNSPSVNQVSPPAVLNAGYLFDNWTKDVASHRLTYKSNTYYLNATGFNNQGTVTTAKFRPDIIRGTTASYMSTLNKQARDAFTRAVESSRPTNDDYIITDQLNDPFYQSSIQILDFGNYSGAINALMPFSANMWVNNILPSTASQLLVFSPKAATRPAKEGAFVVYQQLDETLPWCNNSSNIVVNSIPFGLPLSYMRVSNGTQVSYSPLYSQQVNGSTSSPYTTETFWNSLDWSITIFEGLTVPSQVGTSLTSVPYVTVKSFTGIEIAPLPISSLKTFQRTLPLPDEDAIRMAVGIMHARPDSLPASANDLGSIAATAIKFIPAAVGWLKDLFSKKKEPEPVKAKEPAPRKKTVKPPTNNTGRNNKQNASMVAQISALNKRIAVLTKVTRSEQPATTLPTYNEGSQGYFKNKPIKSQTYTRKRK